jgi:hypothetical protein
MVTLVSSLVSFCSVRLEGWWNHGGMKRDLFAEQVKELAGELSALARRQSQALEFAAYIRMNEYEEREYEVRRTGIGELYGLLGRLRLVTASDPNTKMNRNQRRTKGSITTQSAA